MKKRSFLSAMLIGFVFIVHAQTLYIPSGTSGIGASTNSNIGIGTTNPGVKLSVNGSNSADTETRVDIGGSGLYKSILGLAAGGIDYGQLYFDNTTNNLILTQKYSYGYIGLGTNSRTTDLVVANSGDVGIGTSIPSAKLHVAGTIKIDGLNTLEFGAGVSGKEVNAGKIGYQTFTGDALDIVGAGTTIASRKIKFWNEGGAFFAGSIGIGTTNSGGFKLAVEGKIAAREVLVTNANPFPDYVFAKEYKLLGLKELEIYINKNKHLPRIPSAAEVEQNKGINLGEMQLLQLEKIEEIYLHLLDLNKKVEQLQKENKQLKTELTEVRKRK
jgi:hypothetical protein